MDVNAMAVGHWSSGLPQADFRSAQYSAEPRLQSSNRGLFWAVIWLSEKQ